MELANQISHLCGQGCAMKREGDHSIMGGFGAGNTSKLTGTLSESACPKLALQLAASDAVRPRWSEGSPDSRPNWR